MQEAVDFQTECDALTTILDDATDEDFMRVTQFKNWTIEDIIGHLHVWNFAAAETLVDRENFAKFFSYVAERLAKGESHPTMQRAYINEFQNGLKGKALYDAWREFYPQVATKYKNCDPDMRVAWAGPDMSARSKIIARQMETWSHSQTVFDLMGFDRSESDRIKNIAHLGVTTYSWAFRNRGETPPIPKPFIKLNSPSGAVWEWNDPQTDNIVRGSAVEFCQVVTQTRNVADTSLELIGDTPEQWMQIVQCFAGGPNSPPAKGTRFKAN